MCEYGDSLKCTPLTLGSLFVNTGFSTKSTGLEQEEGNQQPLPQPLVCITNTHTNAVNTNQDTTSPSPEISEGFFFNISHHRARMTTFLVKGYTQNIFITR